MRLTDREPSGTYGETLGLPLMSNDMPETSAHHHHHTDSVAMRALKDANRNPAFVFASRIASFLAVTALSAILAYVNMQTDTIAKTAKRVDVIEFRIDNGQKAREEFQRDTQETLKEMQRQQSVMLQSLAAIIARLDERDRRGN